MLIDAVERYVALHRATGRLFSFDTYLLRLFARHATQRGDQIVRSETTLEWAAQARRSVAARRQRLLVVRRFAKRVRAEDPRHEIPPSDTFGPLPPRRTPYIFATATIRSLLDATATLGSPGSLRPKTYATLLGLLVCTGLRISEALAFQPQDHVDDEVAVLQVAEGDESGGDNPRRPQGRRGAMLISPSNAAPAATARGRFASSGSAPRSGGRRKLRHGSGIRRA